MCNIKDKADEVAAHYFTQFADGPYWSWDNASVHVKSLPHIGIPAGKRIVCPPKSFDMQKVVEHAHATIKGAFARRLNSVPENSTRAELIEIFSNIVDTEVKLMSIRRDVESLKATYREIIKVNGAYPSPEFR